MFMVTTSAIIPELRLKGEYAGLWIFQDENSSLI